MSNSLPAGEPTTRREHLRRLALAAALGQSACLENCDANPGQAILILALYGQAGSRIAERAFRAQRDDNRTVGRLIRSLSEADRLAPPPRTTPLPPGEVNGIAAGSVSGPRPDFGGGPQLTEEPAGFRSGRPGQSVARRATYLLDTLGDAQVDGRVYAFDVFDDRVALRGQVGLRPADRSLPSIQLRHIALSPDGRRLVVSQEGAPSQWIFVDAASLTVTGRIPAPEGQNARRAVFAPDGATVYLVAGTDSTTLPPARLHVADAASRSVVGAIDLPANVSLDDLVATPDGGLLVGAGSGFLHSIDVRSGTYGGRVLVARPASDPAGPRSANLRRLAMDPAGARVYAATVNDIAANRRSIGVFDVRSLDLVDQIFVREPPDFGLPLLKISPDGRELYYAPQLGTGVQIFDLPSGSELATIPVEASFRLTELAVV